MHVYAGRVRIQLLEDELYADMIHVTAPGEQELETIFYRVNNAFVHRLALSFLREDIPVPYYLRANANELQCQIGVLCTEETYEAVDYTLVDFLAFLSSLRSTRHPQPARRTT